MPAGWISCRRCGAAIPIARHSALQSMPPIPASLKAAWSEVRVTDTLLPPRPPTVSRPASTRRAIVVGAAEMAAVLAATTALALTGSRDYRQTEAVARLQSTARDARAFYARKGTLQGLNHAHEVSVVSATRVAKAEQVSLRSTTPTTLVLATPVSRDTCVFGRTSRHAPMGFAVTHDRACRATSAPRKGWRT
ncbi:MAG TPA: hypothetical protein VL856_08925 [Acidimicrobiia bacterium]|nr:hypothetical protein [Acidimicrobiia bacterium]